MLLLYGRGGLKLHGYLGILIMHDRGCILFLVKYPQAGRVKRRLASELGAEVAARLYGCFVEDALATLNCLGFHIIICYHPPHSHAAMLSWLGPGYRYLPQRGRDLGQRMKNGFFDAFASGFQYAIALGSDIPDLPGDCIEEARASLMSCGAVLGPARDGGYYLIGFRRDTFVPAVFEGPRWGTDTVFADTVAILKNEHRSWYTLPCWNDVDTAADLRELYERNRQAIHPCSKTMSYSIGEGILQTVTIP